MACLLISSDFQSFYSINSTLCQSVTPVLAGIAFEKKIFNELTPIKAELDEIKEHMLSTFICSSNSHKFSGRLYLHWNLNK